MKIKEICEKTGLTERAVRLYLERGLLCPASEHRRGRTYHEYSEADLIRLREIAALRKCGFPLEEIGLLLNGGGNPDTLLAGRIAALREEAGDSAKTADALEMLAGQSWLEGGELALAVLRLHCPKTSGDAEPNFGREDGLTRDEKRALARNARKNLARTARIRRILAGAAAALLVLAGVSGWLFWRNCQPVTVISYVTPVVFMDRQLSEDENGDILATARARTEKVEFLAVFRGKEGNLLYNTLFLNREYAMAAVEVEVPRRKAEKLGLMEGDLFRNVWEIVVPDDSLCLRYLSVTELQGDYH